MVFTEDLINIYVDFLPITTTTSTDDALALLISMYTIFELNFPKNSRTVRLLYSLLHGDKRFLTNTIRLFLKEKQIDVIDRPHQNHSISPTSAENKSLSNTTSSQSQSSAEQEKSNDNSLPNNPLDTTTVSPVDENSSKQSSVANDQ